MTTTQTLAWKLKSMRDSQSIYYLRITQKQIYYQKITSDLREMAVGDYSGGVQGVQNQQQKQNMHAICQFRQENAKRQVQFRVKALNKSDKCIEAHALEDIACSSLCELSDNICREETTDRSRNAQVRCTNHHKYSPWRLKNEEITLEPSLSRLKKNMKNRANNLTKYNSTIGRGEGKENINYTRIHKLNKEQIESQKYPSIFMRLRAAKDTKTDMGKKEKSQTEIITIMKRKKPTNKEQLESKKVILIEEIDDHSQNLKLFSKKIEQLQLLKKYSLNSIKQVPSCLLELQSDGINKQKQTGSNKTAKTVIDHWKSRRLSVKSRKTKNVNQSRQTKSIQRRENKQNVLISKKTSLSLEKAYRDQYQSSNPLTRLLYQKYINTINVHQSKQENFHFL